MLPFESPDVAEKAARKFAERFKDREARDEFLRKFPVDAAAAVHIDFRLRIDTLASMVEIVDPVGAGQLKHMRDSSTVLIRDDGSTQCLFATHSGPLYGTIFEENIKYFRDLYRGEERKIGDKTKVSSVGLRPRATYDEFDLAGDEFRLVDHRYEIDIICLATRLALKHLSQCLFLPLITISYVQAISNHQ